MEVAADLVDRQVVQDMRLVRHVTVLVDLQEQVVIMAGAAVLVSIHII